MTVHIEELLPQDAVEAEAVLHVRRQLRRRIRTGAPEERAEALALLFGWENDPERFLGAAEGPSPVEAAAVLVAQGGVATLGHDARHVERCRLHLLTEKEREPALSKIVAFDLGTLLVLSRARELSRAAEGRGRPPIPLLIRGETGTGKELLTAAVHTMSQRDRLETIHVAGMPRDMVYAEIFGHEKGAFTGAAGQRKGRIELADGGTLQLDEVGDLPPDAQVALLRVLQDGRFSRLGSNEPQEVNVRVVACTWHDLHRDIKKGSFRRDLFHRICGAELVLPPLSKRVGEWRALLTAMLARVGAPPQIVRSASDALRAYSWPGNLRELQTVLQVASASAAGSPIRVEDLPPHIQAAYLRLPLDKRAPGLLCDTADGEALPPELYARRVALVEEKLAADTPEPRVPEVVETLLGALAGLPDASGEHEKMLESLQAAVALDVKRAREEAIAGKLFALAAADGLPERLASAVAARAQEHEAIANAVSEESDAESSAVDLNRSPWGRLYLDMAKNPLFAAEDRPTLLRNLGFFVRVLHSFAPSWTLDVAELLRAEGLSGVVARVGEALSRQVNGEDPTDPEPGEPEGPPSTWTKEQWEPRVKEARTKRELAEDLGIHEDTLGTYLTKAGVEPHWSRRRKKE